MTNLVFRFVNNLEVIKSDIFGRLTMNHVISSKSAVIVHEQLKPFII